MYYSSLWRPYLLTDIELLEEYKRGQPNIIFLMIILVVKSRLLRLELLQLMDIYALADIMFFVTSVKFPSVKFDA